MHVEKDNRFPVLTHLFSDERSGRVTSLRRMGTYHSPQHTHKNCTSLTISLSGLGPVLVSLTTPPPPFQSCLFALINHGFFWRNAVNVVNCESSGGHFHARTRDSSTVDAGIKASSLLLSGYLAWRNLVSF